MIYAANKKNHSNSKGKGDGQEIDDYNSICGGYVPPDIIIVDSLVYSNNCSLLASLNEKKNYAAGFLKNSDQAIALHSIFAFETIAEFRAKTESFDFFTPNPQLEKANVPLAQRLACKGHGIIASSDWVSNCIGLGILLPPSLGRMPPKLLGVEKNAFCSPEIFGMPQSPENFPYSWKHPSNGERFSIGDYVVFKNTSGDPNAIQLKGKFMTRTCNKSRLIHVI